MKKYLRILKRVNLLKMRFTPLSVKWMKRIKTEHPDKRVEVEYTRWKRAYQKELVHNYYSDTKQGIIVC